MRLARITKFKIMLGHIHTWLLRRRYIKLFCKNSHTYTQQQLFLLLFGLKHYSDYLSGREGAAETIKELQGLSELLCSQLDTRGVNGKE